MFGFLVSFYYTAFYEPLLNALVFLINVLPTHDIGIAVIILTIIVKFIIFPFQHRSVIAQRKMKSLQPELEEIKEKYKKDGQEQAKKTMELYKRHGVNPFSGFVTILIQLPVFIALYKIFMVGTGFDLSRLYSFIAAPTDINIKFLGLIDMTKVSYLLAVTAGITQFFQMKLAIPPIKKAAKAGKSFKDDLARSMSVQAKYIMPAFIFFIALKFSSAMALYWTTMNIFAIVHESVVKKKAEKIVDNKGQNNGKATGNNQIADRKSSSEDVH
ncbi:MAG: YidC/Oxa1 family membrane protein insertase [bacterium]|nr:YidC/Oxa1 family membrane protein insertase [bacterium]